VRSTIPVCGWPPAGVGVAGKLLRALLLERVAVLEYVGAVGADIQAAAAPKAFGDFGGGAEEAASGNAHCAERHGILRIPVVEGVIGDRQRDLGARVEVLVDPYPAAGLPLAGRAE